MMAFTHFLVPVIIALSVTPHSFSAAVPSYECKQTIVPVNISTHTQLNLAEPQNQTVITALIASLTIQTSNVSADVVGPEVPFSGAYDIWTELCVPKGFPSNGTLELTIHGATYDHTYWTFGGSGSPYNYAEAALTSGHAVLLFDRLGEGLSSHPNGFQAVQVTTGVEVVVSLLRYLRSAETGYSFGRIVAVGHSLGSITAAGVAAKYGNAFDAMVLTGFSSYTAGFPPSFAGMGLMVAAKVDSARWSNLSTSYITRGSIVSSQDPFYWWPYFDPDVLEQDDASKGTMTVGEILTLPLPLSSPAVDYTNEVFVVNGEYDISSCGGNCYQSENGSSNLLEPTRSLYPSASVFSVYVTPNTGHCLNLHYTASHTFEVIQGWIGK